MNEQDQEKTTYKIKLSEDIKAVLQAVGEMRREMSDRFDKIESEQAELKQEFTELKQEFTGLKQEFTELKREFTGLKQEFTEFKHSTDGQFEVVRQGIVQNFNQSNQIISEISQNRSAIYNAKAQIGELQEKFFLFANSNRQPV